MAACDDHLREVPEDAAVPLGGLAGNLLPYAAVAVGLLVSTLDFLEDGRDGQVTYWARLVLVVLIVARQILTLSENQSLTRHLEKRVEDRTAELRASKERFEALVQHSSDLVTVVDVAGTVLYQSRSSERVLGYRADELTGRSLLDVVDPDSAARSGSRSPRRRSARSTRRAC